VVLVDVAVACPLCLTSLGKVEASGCKILKNHW
jgi:hypothetical protein